MSESTTYNGWSNRETWVANLWLTNDQEYYLLLKEAISMFNSALVSAEWLKEQIRDQLDDESAIASMWSDLLSTAFYRINWQEIIASNLD